MDQHKHMRGNTVNEAFGRRFMELSILWAVLFTLVSMIRPQLPETAGWLTFLLQVAVMVPVMAALRLTYKNAEMDRMIRFFCRMMYIVMVAAMAVMFALVFI